MMRSGLVLVVALLALGCSVNASPAAPGSEGGAAAGAEKPLPKVAEKSAGMERRGGLLPIHVDADRGRVFLELPPAGEGGLVGRYIYLEGIITGLGSNPVGLDRGQTGEPVVVALRRFGGKLLVEVENPQFRALTDNPEERRAVEESFAESVIWGTDLIALDPDGTALVDLSSFLLRDAHGIVDRLEGTGQGTFSLDAARSAVDPAACHAFPDNLELEAIVTYGGKKPGRHLRATAPVADSLTFRQHLSLVRLPDDGYRPRLHDPRAASYEIGFLDYAAPLDEPLEQHWLVRHRLDKQDPAAASSPPVEPIVYYVDRGIPEPVRSAVVDGVSWWAEGFEAAGFEDAFKVELLPPDVHPLDVRYNVIQWIHRSTRGWSYGGGVHDPRTGEVIQGRVWLGSLRVRQDRLLFEGLAGVAKTGSGEPDDPVQLALARIRQLAAHEVGHALGFNHNFAASTWGGRASVMDYPAPLVTVTDDGELDFSRAYAVGIGAWDVHGVRHAYSQFPEGADEAAELEKIVQEGIAQGYLYLTDADARPLGGAHPFASLWDNGRDPAAALPQTMAVRRIALDRFGEGNIAEGRPLTLLNEVLAPLYFHHRYQVDAAVKLIAGAQYTYALRGDGQPPIKPLRGAYQRRALAAILATLDPAELDLPDEVLRLLLPRAPGYPDNRELFTGGADPLFDPVAAAATAASMVVDGLLEPHRAARLVDQHRRDAYMLSLEETIARLIAQTFDRGSDLPPRLLELRRAIHWVVVDGLIDLASHDDATPAVVFRAESTLADLGRRLAAQAAGSEELVMADTRKMEAVHAGLLARRIDRYLDRQLGAQEQDGPEPPPLPPGSPIGSGALYRGGAAYMGGGYGDAPLPGTLSGCGWDRGR